MNRFYRGDLVLWPGEPWARGPWEVIEDGPMVSPITGGQTVTSYLIRPHRGAGDSYRVDAGSLTRYTRIDDAYEVGTRVIWEPQGYRRRALTGMSRAIVMEAYVGTIESAQNNPQWAGDVLLRFPTAQGGDWMQFAWRADCRRAPAERSMTATQVLESRLRAEEVDRLSADRARREVLSSADVTETVYNGERLYRARDGQHFTTMTAAMRHNGIVEQMRGPAPMSPADELIMEREARMLAMLPPTIQAAHREQILGVDLASGPDQTSTITIVNNSMVPPSTIVADIHGALARAMQLSPDVLKPVAKPIPPTVIGGKRKLKL